MTRENLPAKIDPFRFADNTMHLQGRIPIKDMLRLSDGIPPQEGEASVALQFGVNEQGIRFLEGQVEATILLQCQRCLEVFKHVIISRFLLGIVQSEEEIDALPERFDPVVVKDGELLLFDILEDELIVNLPIVPMHELSLCHVKHPFAAMSDTTQEMEKENPFKVIEWLREKKESQK